MPTKQGRRNREILVETHRKVIRNGVVRSRKEATVWGFLVTLSFRILDIYLISSTDLH
jgi:hypothetical protein